MPAEITVQDGGVTPTYEIVVTTDDEGKDILEGHEIGTVCLREENSTELMEIPLVMTSNGSSVDCEGTIEYGDYEYILKGWGLHVAGSVLSLDIVTSGMEETPMPTFVVEWIDLYW